MDKPVRGENHMAKSGGGIHLNEGGATENSVGLNPIVGVAREDLIGAVGVMLRETAGAPMRTLKHMKNFGDEVVKIVTNKSELAPDPKDKRFHDPAFRTNPLYKAGMQYYLAVRKGMNEMVKEAEFDELERARANFVTGMILDAMAPTNTLVGNPSALKKALETGGGSLLKGLQNAYTDITKNEGIVSQVDKRPFKLGENVACSPGAVVYRTEIMELIQYKPATADVHAIPFMIIPPQINKAYVNDLTAEKSIVKYLVDGGIQTFMVSWRNPTADHADWGLADYVDALIEASDVVLEITGSKVLNVSGACSGGITTATLLSKLASEADDRVNSATLMVCVLDPQREDSETGALISKHGLELARQRSKKAGVLEGSSLSRMFAWLRPNDLVWNYVINNYLHGEDPPAFDVLFWNNDSTNLTAQLHSDYLDIYEDQPFRRPGKVKVADHKVDLTKFTKDAFFVAGVTDHITPWKACYRATQLIGSENVEFILSQSGHIQALLNPPGNPKAKYFRSEKRPPETIDEWMGKDAKEHAGSWWPYWREWLQARSGDKIAAPAVLGSKKHRPGTAAPGKYVFD
jgi:polyhydroxyalkanoate synthase